MMTRAIGLDPDDHLTQKGPTRLRSHLDLAPRPIDPSRLDVPSKDPLQTLVGRIERNEFKDGVLDFDVVLHAHLGLADENSGDSAIAKALYEV